MKKLALLVLMVLTPMFAAASCDIGYSRYTGWEVHAYIDQYGILDKWNKKYGTDCTMDYYGDYVESLTQYGNGQIDGVTATNFDMMVGPATTGITSIALYNGDVSNGNDAIITRNGDSCAALAGQEVLIVEGSVSQLLLAACLHEAGLTFDDVTLTNTSDADIATVYLNSPTTSAVTWNPPLQQALNDTDTLSIFDSSQTDGLIIDSTWINADRVNSDERKALTGAWYEAMQILSTRGKAQLDMITFMSENSQTPSVKQFQNQMRTTGFFYTSQDAVNFTNTDSVKSNMNIVRQVLFDGGMYAPGSTKDIDGIGVQFADGSIQGNPNNVRMIFDTEYMKAHADGNITR